MTAYKATFSDGSVKQIKNSKRVYAAAWQAKVTREDKSIVVLSGFARDHDLASRSAMSEAKRVGGKWNGCRWQPVSLPIAVEVVHAEAQA